MYQYQAIVLRIVDGDTVHLLVNLGFDVTRSDSFRLAGINAPEIRTPEGAAAKAHLTELLAPGLTMVTTHKDSREKYGRYLATLWVGTTNINEQMVTDGHAVHYSGGPR